MQLEKYSFGIGDRFGREGVALLSAIKLAGEKGIKLVPVWNKSYREHSIIGSKPSDTSKNVAQAVKSLNWTDSFYIDADHINSKSVDFFIDNSNFFTLDVGEFIGSAPEDSDLQNFLSNFPVKKGLLEIPGINQKIEISVSNISSAAQKYLKAIKEAGKIYRHIKDYKKSDDFVVEISMDEVSEPQTPEELFFILSAVSLEAIPIQTIAPKFIGSFYKGVNYVGDVARFEKEFEDILLIVEFAKKTLNLPSNLKLSLHSGSDKFSIYPVINRLLKKYDAGIHVKTAGTTWLEELIGITLSGDKGLTLVKDVYTQAYRRIDELLKPYLHSVDISFKNLPLPAEVEKWDCSKMVGALQHDLSNPAYNKDLRQLFHIAFRIAAEKGEAYYEALDYAWEYVDSCVTNNIYERHIRKIFF